MTFEIGQIERRRYFAWLTISQSCQPEMMRTPAQVIYKTPGVRGRVIWVLVFAYPC